MNKNYIKQYNYSTDLNSYAYKSVLFEMFYLNTSFMRLNSKRKIYKRNLTESGNIFYDISNFKLDKYMRKSKQNNQYGFDFLINHYGYFDSFGDYYRFEENNKIIKIEDIDDITNYNMIFFENGVQVVIDLFDKIYSATKHRVIKPIYPDVYLCKYYDEESNSDEKCLLNYDFEYIVETTYSYFFIGNDLYNNDYISNDESMSDESGHITKIFFGQSSFGGEIFDSNFNILKKYIDEFYFISTVKRVISKEYEGKFCLHDYSGAIISSFKGNEIKLFNDFILVSNNQNSMIISLISGDIYGVFQSFKIVGNVYMDLFENSSVETKYIIVESNNMFGVLNSNLDIIIPFKYSKIDYKNVNNRIIFYVYRLNQMETITLD